MKKAMKQSTMTNIISILSVLLILLSLVVFFFIMKVDQDVNQANRNRFDLTYNANRFMDGSAYLTNEVRAFAVTGEQDHYDNYWNEVNVLKNRDIGVQNMRDIGVTAEEQRLIERMSSLSNELVPLEEHAMELVLQGKREEAIETVYGDYYADTIQTIRGYQREFLSALDARTGREVEEVQSLSGQLIVVMMLCLFATVAVQLISAVAIRRKVITPLIAIKNEMQEISQGNLNTPFALEPDTSEMGLLVESIVDTKMELHKYIEDITRKLEALAQGDMTAKGNMAYRGDFLPIKQSMVIIQSSLNRVLREVAMLSTDVSFGSRQIAQAANDLSQRSVQNAATIDQFSSASVHTEEVAKQNMETAAKAMEDVRESSALMKSSVESMRHMLEAMGRIDESSRSIQKIIQVIDNISYQTNLLALNASVEAARAGVHGKGFAVVAGEVGELAAKSAVAAKETAKLIKQSTRLVADGNRMMAEVSEKLESVSAIAENNRQAIEAIGTASLQQSESMKEIAQGIVHFSAVSQENTAMAEESAASAQQISDNAAELDKLIAQFKLDEIGEEPVPADGEQGMIISFPA